MVIAAHPYKDFCTGGGQCHTFKQRGRPYACMHYMMLGPSLPLAVALCHEALWVD